MMAGVLPNAWKGKKPARVGHRAKVLPCIDLRTVLRVTPCWPSRFCPRFWHFARRQGRRGLQ
jgi:hypothetical protein